MNLIKQIRNVFKVEMDIWFFYFFILTFPFSVRKIITFYPIQDQFNEWSGIYLYLSDIFLISTLFFWIFLLCHKYRVLSIYTGPSFFKDNLWKRIYPQITPNHFLAYLGLILVLWSFLSLGWSESKSLSLFRSMKIMELYLLAIFVAYRIVPRGTFLKDIFKLIILGGVINSIISIWQFLIQHSVGLSFVKESTISPSMSGVAKIILNGQIFIRSYGFFPHPNILGGFLLFSIILTIYYRQMFHACPSEECSTWNIRRGVEHFWSGGIFISWNGVLLAIQTIALALTFSKSAIVGLAIALIYINVPRLPREPKLFHVEQFRGNWGGTFAGGWNIRRGVEHSLKLVLITFLGLFIAISIFPNLSPIRSQSLDQREILSIVAPARIAAQSVAGGRGTTTDLKTLFFGVGQGQSVWHLRNNLDLLDWQFQPAHNVFLLIWSELGIIGLILFVWILWKMFHVEHFWVGGTLLIFRGILLGFIFVLLFDHYLWDIQQGQIMLWLMFGFIYGLGLPKKRL